MKKNLWQKTLLVMALTLLFTSCAQKQTPVAANEIITQKPTPEGRTPITVLVKYAFSINTFEKAVEEKFPEIDIIQVGNFTSNSGIREYEARMEHDDLTDIVMTWPVQAGQEYCEERLIDLSSMPLTGKYYTSGLDKISSGGKLYYLPGPSQIRGIVYNKTLFEENGWQVPDSFEGFISLCKKIEDKGIRSLQLGFGNPEVLDTAFVGYSYADCYSTPQDAKWLKDYNQGNGSLADHFMPAFKTFQRLIDEGIFKKEDLNITYADRERMLFRRECAMVEDSVLMARMGNDIAGCEDEFALMPFFNPSEDGDWAWLYPVCYIGLNKHLEEEQNKEKYALVMKIMEYISTPEGQLALSGDTGGMYSPLNGMPPPDVGEIEPLYSALEHGRCAVFPQFKNAQVTLRKGLAGMLKGEMTAQEVIQITDKENISPSADMSPLVIG
ncbi:MAG: ABC transporter substrate-binding protein, partial [Oscillospiraceae bacterium]